MVTSDTKMGWNCYSEREKRKYNSKIPTAIWLPPQYVKQQVLKFRRGTYVTLLEPWEALLKGQCPDYAHARASSVLSQKDNWAVILTRQDFLPDRTADGDLLVTFSSNILDFRRSPSPYLKFGSRHEDYYVVRRYYDFKSTIWSLQWWPTSLLWLVLCISAVNLLFKTFSGVLPHSILVNSSTEVFRIKIRPWKVRRCCRNAFQQQKNIFENSHIYFDQRPVSRKSRKLFGPEIKYSNLNIKNKGADL